MSDGLRFTAVQRRFGDRLAVDHLDLDCPPGALTCLVGPNGAGKSTALGMAAGLLAPSSGAISFDHCPVRPEVPPKATGYLPQHSAFHPSLRVAEVVDFTVAARAADDGERQAALEVTRLAVVLGRFVGELSGGWVRRLGLFSALLGAPSLLLLDEPFVGLDPETHDRLLDHLRARLDSGATVVMTSHDFEVLDPFRPHVAVLDEGRLRLLASVATGRPADAPRAGGEPAGFASCRRIYRQALGAGPAGAPGELA